MEGLLGEEGGRDPMDRGVWMFTGTTQSTFSVLSAEFTVQVTRLSSTLLKTVYKELIDLNALSL